MQLITDSRTPGFIGLKGGFGEVEGIWLRVAEGGDKGVGTVEGIWLGVAEGGSVGTDDVSALIRILGEEKWNPLAKK